MQRSQYQDDCVSSTHKSISPLANFILPSSNRRTTFALLSAAPSRRRAVSCRFLPRPSGSPGPGRGPGAPSISRLGDRESNRLFIDHLLCCRRFPSKRLCESRERQEASRDPFRKEFVRRRTKYLRNGPQERYSRNPLREWCSADTGIFYWDKNRLPKMRTTAKIHPQKV